MQTLKELSKASEESDDVFPLIEAITSVYEELFQVQLDESRTSTKRFNKFFNANKELVKDASVIAVSDFAKYNKNTRKTVTLHAKDVHERRTISQIVDSLVSSKKFKIHKMKFHSGRKIWILKKV